MNNYMRDIDDPVEPSVQTETNSTTYSRPPENTSAVHENVYTADDVYSAGRLSSGNEKSLVMEILMAVLGAVVGALPGVILWILLGKVGFIAAICGSLLASGSIAGYTFMTKNSSLPDKYGVIICLAVIIISIFMAQKVVWCWELADQFVEFVAGMKSELYELADAEGVSRTDVDGILNDSLVEEFGFYKGTFGECFSNFGRLLTMLDARGEYIFNLLECYLFAALGGFSVFKKLM